MITRAFLLKISVIFLILIIQNYYCFSQDFLTFENKQNISIFPEDSHNYIIKDEKNTTFEDIMSGFTKVYFNEDHNIGLKILIRNIETLKITIFEKQIDLFDRNSENLNSGIYIVDFTQFTRTYLQNYYRKRGSTGEDLKKKIKKGIQQYLVAGGVLFLEIKYKNEESARNFELLPENYGWILSNKELPITVQYSEPFSEKFKRLSNTAHLYWPIQYIVKRSKKKRSNLTDITKRFSFGPFIMAQIGTKGVDTRGCGIMSAFGLSEEGRPILGIGIGYEGKSKKCFSVWSFDGVELIRQIIIFIER